MSQKIDLYYPNKRILREHFTHLIIWVSIIDLTKTAHLLKHRYSSNPRGRKPRNPCDMLRSLLLMHKLQYTSVDKWVDVVFCQENGHTFLGNFRLKVLNFGYLSCYFPVS